MARGGSPLIEHGEPMNRAPMISWHRALLQRAVGLRSLRSASWLCAWTPMMRPNALAVATLTVSCGIGFARAQQSPSRTEHPPDGSAKPVVKNVDPRFRTPRATVRTFLIAMNQTDEDPHKIAEAVACFDLSGIPPDQLKNERFATQLEYVLRSTNIPTFVIPDTAEGPECEVGEGKEIKLRLHRMADGRWLFDSATLQNLTKMQLYLWNKGIAAGQGKESADVPADFRSPYAMYQTFFEASKSGDLDTAAKCLDLSEIADPARHIVGRNLAVKLQRVLDRTLFIILQDIPDSSVGVPLVALVHKEGRLAAERQSTGKRKGQWLWNRATVRSLDRLYDEFEMKPLVPELVAMGRKESAPLFRLSPELWIRYHMPSALRLRVGAGDSTSLALYQILGLAVLILLTVPAYHVISWLLGKLTRAAVRWRGLETTEPARTGWIRPVGWLGVIAILVEGIKLLDLRSDIASVILAWLIPAFCIVFFLAVYQFIDPIMKLIAGPAATRIGASTLAAMGYPVISLVLKIIVVACGIGTVLTLFDFDVGTVLAGLGIGGLAFALAAQDTLKNFFGSIMLIADRTFRVGDLVQIGANSGVVESVGLRTTRIRGLDDALLTIPNSDLVTAHVTNFGGRRYRRFRTEIPVPHGTPPARLIEFRDGVLKLIQNRSAVRPDNYEVAVNDLDKSGIKVLIQVFFDVPNGHAELQARESLILDIIQLADQLGVAPLGVRKESANGEPDDEKSQSQKASV
jgi:MscS family membrane protein